MMRNHVQSRKNRRCATLMRQMQKRRLDDPDLGTTGKRRRTSAFVMAQQCCSDELSYSAQATALVITRAKFARVQPLQCIQWPDIVWNEIPGKSPTSGWRFVLGF